MPQPGWREIVFSFKTFGSAMLALFVAFSLNLTQPSWAMLTALVVSQPVAGMVLAKSVFRVVGTIAGGVAALVMVALFAQDGSLFLIALALWIGACTAVSVLLRDAPAAYGAVLSGYTAAIVGLPSALAPDTAFDYTIGRCLEILIGIGCATLVSQLIFPVTAGTALKGSVETTVGAVSRWIADVLRNGNTDKQAPSDRQVFSNGQVLSDERTLSDEQVLADQRRMVADVIALDALRVFATFDTPSVRAASDVARHLQGQVLGLLSLMISIHDRMSVLRTQAAAKEAVLQPFLARTADLLDPDRPADPGTRFEDAVERLQGDIDGNLPAFADMVRDRETILVRNILLRLRDVLGTWRRIRELRDGLFAGRPMATMEAAPSAIRYRDVTLALVAGAISTTAVLATSAFWVATGWPQGSSAVIFSGVICSILASLDDPATAAANFLRMTVYAAIAAAFYAFWILPRIDGFASLVLVLLPFYLPFGILLALPRVGTQVTPLGLNLAALIGLTNTGVPTDFAAFLNSTLALLFGIAAGILAFRLLRPLGVEWAVHRIRRSALRDLQILAEPEAAFSRTIFIGRMLDRIGALFTRIAGEGADQRDILRGSLAGLRVGLNIIALKQGRHRLPPAPAAIVETILSALARHFRDLKNDRPSEAPLPLIHGAITTILSQEPGPYEDTLTALVAIASALTRHAGYFGVADPVASPLPLPPPLGRGVAA